MDTPCAVATMDQGEFNVEASVNMVGEYDEATTSVDDKISDMIQVNNAYSFDFSVINYEPQILFDSKCRICAFWRHANSSWKRI